MARGLCAGAVTAEDVMAIIGGDVPPEPESQRIYAPLPPVAEESAAWQAPRLPWWRKALAAVSGLVALAIFWHAAKYTDLTALVGGGTVSAAGWSAVGSTPCSSRPCSSPPLPSTAARPPVQLQTPVQKRKLSRRTRVSAALILVGVPAVLFVGSCYFDLKTTTSWPCWCCWPACCPSSWCLRAASLRPASW